MDGEVRDNNVPFRWSAAPAVQIEGVGWRFQRRATRSNNRWMQGTHSVSAFRFVPDASGGY
jgi:hypothetical protein